MRLMFSDRFVVSDIIMKIIEPSRGLRKERILRLVLVVFSVCAKQVASEVLFAFLRQFGKNGF